MIGILSYIAQAAIPTANPAQGFLVLTIIVWRHVIIIVDGSPIDWAGPWLIVGDPATVPKLLVEVEWDHVVAILVWHCTLSCYSVFNVINSTIISIYIV